MDMHCKHSKTKMIQMIIKSLVETMPLVDVVSRENGLCCCTKLRVNPLAVVEVGPQLGQGPTAVTPILSKGLSDVRHVTS